MAAQLILPAPAQSELASDVQTLKEALPAADPGTELVHWNGTSWAITNNRLFESQFDKYLSTPPLLTDEAKAYRDIMQKIQSLLSPSVVTPASVDQAYGLLSEATASVEDGNLSDVLANQIYLAWMAKRDTGRIDAATKTLETERKRLEWNLRVTTRGNPLEPAPGGSAKKGGSVSVQTGAAAEKATELELIGNRLIEVNALLKANQAKGELSLAQARTDFQVMIVQFFLQRRFEHVIIATKFYRTLFTDGKTQVQLGEEAMNLFSRTTGNPPTLGSLESAAREMMMNVRQGVQAFEVMLADKQLESAAKRLSEAFMIGEYLPEIATVPLEQKQALLGFVQRANRLKSALEVRDYSLAETLVTELRERSSDTDLTKANAAIQSVKVAAGMHLAQARNAAISGDKATLESELKTASELWPTNPQLSEVSKMIFEQADVQGRALIDFDQLVAQKNFRQIAEDKLRFIAATANVPEKQKQLGEVLANIAAIDVAILQAREIEKHGDPWGAWEMAEAAFAKFPDDNRLNQVRADLTVKSANFVNALNDAARLEAAGEPGSALMAFLQARKIYPSSTVAREGIVRLSKSVLPDAQ